MLLIEGARRIDKSTFVEEFSKNEYRNYLMIDFSKVTDSVVSAFNNHMNDFDTFFLILSSVSGVGDVVLTHRSSYLMRYNSFRKPGKR